MPMSSIWLDNSGNLACVDRQTGWDKRHESLRGINVETDQLTLHVFNASVSFHCSQRQPKLGKQSSLNTQVRTITRPV
eukprot:612771-Rhodomonas_salina.3